MKKFLLFLSIIIGVIGEGFATFCSANAVDDERIINDDIPELYIRAVNPGYTIEGKSNVGEMIEISRKNSDAPISLAGTAVS